MKVWIIAIILLFLSVLLLRERYTNYEEALKAVGQTAGYINPTCSDPDYEISSDKSVCKKTLENGRIDEKPPVCPAGTQYRFRETEGVCEPTGVATPSEETTDPSCPTGFTFNRDDAQCQRREGERVIERAAGTCATGEVMNTRGRCSKVAGSIPTPVSSGSNTPMTTIPTATVGGGSSGNLIGSTSGGTTTGGVGKNVWGPVFSGIGENAVDNGGDSTRTSTYPELLGGAMGKQSAMVPGVGIVSPSQPGLTTSTGFGLDLGVMPSSASLGTDANARFLPFSRQPGDPDIGSDPYRLASSYSTKNYSPQPEPVPFLTDFSAFFK
jgi:hypothetical protein